MSIKPDTWIRNQCLNRERPMIEPFEPNPVKEEEGQRVISYGTSSYGYDARLSPEIELFTQSTGEGSFWVDPKHFDVKNLRNVYSEAIERRPIYLPPNSFALASTVEYFRIPRDVLVICLGKSTYARCGLIVNVTPLEPEWEGHVTIELSNTSPSSMRIYPGEGICQFLFIGGDGPCATSYADRGGKYQGQRGITLPKV